MYIMHLDDPVTERYSVVTSMTFETLERGQFLPEEKASLDDSRVGGHDVRSFLQAASDAAWEIGIRPNQLQDDIKELSATKYHLEDMRQLAGVKK
jgi:UDP-N-acetylmuramyl pentapeptide synthase